MGERLRHPRAPGAFHYLTGMTMKASAEEFRIMLPYGFWLDDICYRDAYIRPLTGEDEVFMMETGDVLMPFQRDISILARCLTRLGPVKMVSVEDISRLTAGDRWALLLHLRRVTLGERMKMVLSCPLCSEKMDLDLKIGDLLLPPYAHAQEWFEKEVKEEGKSLFVRFRLPNGSDLEAASVLSKSDREAASRLVLQWCVERITQEEGVEVSLDECPPAVLQSISSTMDELDPQAELTLNLCCPACGHTFCTLLDISSFFFKEISVYYERFYTEVHFLAFYYHWSETEIMGLTCRRRHRYFESLAEALSE